MNRVGVSIVDRLSRLLDPNERDAVVGDLTELKASTFEAVSDLVGLIARRQAALWLEWRPWLALVGGVVPLGWLLSRVAHGWAAHGAIYSWLYFNNWTWGFLSIPGARRDLLQTVADFLGNSFVLAGWSWSAGAAIASLSKRTIWLSGGLFSALLLNELLLEPQNAYGANAAVFTLTFYRVVFPAILRIVLVVAPAIWGMRSGGRSRAYSRLPIVATAVVVAILTVRITGQSAYLRSWPFLLLPLFLMWPVVYIVLTARHTLPLQHAR